jgi:hypothetical protein
VINLSKVKISSVKKRKIPAEFVIFLMQLASTIILEEIPDIFVNSASFH